MNADHFLVDGRYFFGADDWSNYGWLSVEDAKNSQVVPMDIAKYLHEPCPFISGQLVKETHFLFYLPSELSGISLTINSMRRLLKDQNLLRFYSPIGGWFSQHDFACFSDISSWKLLFAGSLPNSQGLTYKKQKRLLREGEYTVPFARTVVAMIILKAKKSVQILSENEWGRSSESYDDGLRIRVGVFDKGAICLSSRWSGRGYHDTGIFAEKYFK